MTYRVVITAKARGQLERITRWYEETSGSQRVAEKWYVGFLQALESLCENPDRCGLARENDFVEYTLYALIYGSGRKKTHRALFTINEDVVEVRAIRHLSQRDLTADEL